MREMRTHGTRLAKRFLPRLICHIASRPQAAATIEKGCCMLVLSRKVGEKIVIDDKVKITITRISGGRVSVGIEAPSGVRIVRGELKPLPEQQPAPLHHNRVAGRFPDEQPSEEFGLLRRNS
jgi:carbon storage regulator CsrA